MFRYTLDFQEQAAEEYDAMQANDSYPATRRLIDDYHTTRETIRACGR